MWSGPKSLLRRGVAAGLKEEVGVDCIMLAPLRADDEETSKGNLRREYAFKGMMVPYKSENFELLLKYMNWLYSSTDNYELAYYGIKGVHWVEGEDVTIGGRTYKTWAYPPIGRKNFRAPIPIRAFSVSSKASIFLPACMRDTPRSRWRG